MLFHCWRRLVCHLILISLKLYHLLPSLPNCLYTDPSSAYLLGSPLGDVACISAALRTKVASLSVMGERLRLLTAHDSILLLCYSFAIPKLLYLLQTAPCFLSSILHELTPLSVLLLVVSVMCPCLLLTRPGFQASLLSVQVVWDSRVWYSWHLLPSWPLLQYPFLCSLLSWLRSNLRRFPFKRLLLITGQLPWLMLLLHLVRLQVSRELGISPRFLQPSPPCVIMLQIPFLVLAFKLSPLHNICYSILQRALSAAGVPSRLEPSGLVRSDGKRPDVVTMVPWSSGKPLIWDAPCPDTLAPSHVSVAVYSPGSVAGAAEVKKCAKYKSLNHSYSFTPVAIETLGAFGPMSLKFPRALGMEQSGEVSSTATSFGCSTESQCCKCYGNTI